MRWLARLLPILLVLGACTPQGASPSAPASTPTPAASASTDEATPTPATSEPAAAPTPAATTAPPIAWQQLEVVGPSAREDHTWTLAGSSGTAVLFGGRDGSTVFNDTWTFDVDARSWTRITTPTFPTARFGHEAAWVEGLGVVIFAGQGGPTTFFNDLWLFDTEASSWRQLPADGAVPTPRYGSCLALGVDGRLWMSHGFTQEGARFSDTRAYDLELGRWEDQTPDGGRPVDRCLHGCWWSDDGDLVLYAGQTTGVTALDDLWTLAGGSWTRNEVDLPPARNLYARDRLDGATLVFGGQAVDGGYLDDLWLLPDGGAPEEVQEAGAGPSGRAGAELIVDRENDRAFLFGGRTAESVLDDTWMVEGI